MRGRTYRFMNDALFPFGFGLSYTEFSVGNAKISKTELKTGETATLTIPVANLGKRNGTEVVQVYIRKTNDTDGALKTLRGFQRIEVPAGKTNQAIIELPFSSFEFYDETQLKMTSAPGDYEIFYGNSSADKDLKKLNIKLL